MNEFQEGYLENLDRALSIERLFTKESVKITGSDLIKSVSKEITFLERKPITKVIERQLNVFKKAIEDIDPTIEIMIPKTSYEKLRIYE